MKKKGEKTNSINELSNVKITNHAVQRFVERASALGISFSENNPEKTIKKILKRAVPENPKNYTTRWELFKRNITRKGNTKTYIADGWRFVVDITTNTLITIERVKVHENFAKNYITPISEYAEESAA